MPNTMELPKPNSDGASDYSVPLDSPDSGSISSDSGENSSFVDTGDATSSDEVSSNPSRPWMKLAIAGVVVAAGIGLAAWVFRDVLTANASKETDGSTSGELLAGAVTVSHDRDAVFVDVFEAGEIPPPESFQRYRGTVIARRDSSLGFRRGGRVIRVWVNEGDSVQQGQRIAELDTAELVATQGRLQAQLASAQAALDEAISGPRVERIRVAAAEANRSAARLNQARANLDRQERLDNRGAGSRQTLDDARFEVEQWKADSEAAQARHAELLEGTRVEQLAAARAAVAQAKAALDQNAVQFEDSLVTAPFDGVVASRNIDEGAIVSPDAIAVRLIEAPPLEARFGLPPAAASRLTFESRLMIESTTETLSARLVRRHPLLDLETRTRTVDVVFAPDANVLVGQSVTLLLRDNKRSLASSVSPERPLTGGASIGSVAPSGDAVARRAAASHWVPTGALARSSRGLWSVMVAVPIDRVSPDAATVSDRPVSKIERRDVRVLRTTGALSEITGMLEPGEWVVASGLHRIGPGVKVIAKVGSPSPLPEQTRTGLTVSP
ncbi:MAG: efflux RND transporter periplasmic adaptor subunit [Planctomycetota bacterium]